MIYFPRLFLFSNTELEVIQTCIAALYVVEQKGCPTGARKFGLCPRQIYECSCEAIIKELKCTVLPMPGRQIGVDKPSTVVSTFQ